MKTIGLIGGMSWESTAEYYRMINEMVKQDLGGLHSAQILLYSVDFDPIEHYQSQGNWEACGKILTEIALKLENAGADFIAICTNTMHKVVPIIEASISIPILHIAHATAHEIQSKGIKKIALLGTKYTMQEDFYKDKLIDQGIEVMIPSQEDITLINTVIFEELCLGICKSESKQVFLNIINTLTKDGVEGVVLGCTEIGLLIQQDDLDIPVFDTALIHASAIAQYALKQ